MNVKGRSLNILVLVSKYRKKHQDKKSFGLILATPNCTEFDKW